MPPSPKHSVGTAHSNPSIPSTTDNHNILAPSRLLPFAALSSNRHRRGGTLPASTPRGFLPWTLSDDGPGAYRTIAIGRRPKPFTIAVVSGLLNSKKLLRCTFGDNLERRPKCWIGVLRVGGIVHYASIAHLFLLMV